MSELKNLDVSKLLPPSIAGDDDVQALAKTITEQLLQVNTDIENIRLWENLPRLSDEALLSLAWQFHVDLYDSSQPKETRVQLIQESLIWHRFRGTLYAVETGLQTLLKTGKVKEWFNYDGKAYHFRAESNTPFKLPTQVQQMLAIVAQTKNVRSWLDGIDINLAPAKKVIYVGAKPKIKRTVHVYPASQTNAETDSALYIGMAAAVEEIVESEVIEFG